MYQKSILLVIGKPGQYTITDRSPKVCHKSPVYRARWRKHIVTETGADFIMTLCGKLYAISECNIAKETDENPLCKQCMHHIIPDPRYVFNARKARAAQLKQ